MAWKIHPNTNNNELFKKSVNIPYEGMTITELSVEIERGKEVSSISKKWRGELGNETYAKYFFSDGDIMGFDYGTFGGPGDLLNREQEIDKKLKTHYLEIKSFRPNVANNLETCIQKLEQPGVNYQKK